MTTQDQRRLAFSYVRFSSEKQRQGASFERQTEAAKRWAEENGFILDNSVDLNDDAVSAFKGDNTSIGKLGAFKKLAENGTIPVGSVLIVESLDRISRDHWEDAFYELRGIMRCGIDIVTLSNGRWYKADKKLNMMEGVEMILTFERAHEESLTKSKRVSDAWRRNTEKVKAGTRKRSSAIPNWLRLEGTLDDGHFEVIEETAEVTRELYRRFADGETVWGIAKDFRDRGIKTPRGKTFASGNIYRLISSKAPYGTLEIGRGTKNDREVIDQIDDYFPRIVDEDTQRRVMMRLQDMRKHKEAKALTSPKRKTHGILTGVIWSPRGNRCVCRKSTDGSWAYVESVTRRWVASRNVIESRFLAGWSEIVGLHGTDSSPEVDAAEAAVLAAEGMLETAGMSGSERLLVAAQADLEDAERHLKEVRRGQALAAVEVPESLEGLEPWEANQWVKMVVDRVTVIRGGRAKGQTRKTMLEVTLKNGLRVTLGDLELLFGETQ